MILAANPKTRAELLAIADKWDRKQMKAMEVAKEVFDQVLEQGIRMGEARSGKRTNVRPDDIFDDPSRLIVLPPVPDRQSIEADTSEAPHLFPSPATWERGPGGEGEKSHRPINQDRRTTPHHRSRSKRESALDRPSKLPDSRSARGSCSCVPCSRFLVPAAKPSAPPPAAHPGELPPAASRRTPPPSAARPPGSSPPTARRCRGGPCARRRPSRGRSGGAGPGRG
jgi:hypothetical protein